MNAPSSLRFGILRWSVTEATKTKRKLPRLLKAFLALGVVAICCCNPFTIGAARRRRRL